MVKNYPLNIIYNDIISGKYSKTLYTGNRSIKSVRCLRESRQISFLIDNERYTGDRNFRFTSIELARNSGKWVNAGLFSLQVRTHSATE